MSESMQIEVQRVGAVGVVALARPEVRNALGYDNWSDLADKVEELTEDTSVKVIVITGKGIAFSAGADIRRGNDESLWSSAIPPIHRSLLAVYRCPKPTIAAIEGACLGAGWSLALACDLLIAGEGAFFEPPFPSRGVLSGGGILWFLSQRLGRYEMARLLWCNVRYDASEALVRGLLSEVVPQGHALEASLDVARRLAESPVTTMTISKSIMRRSVTPFLEVALNGEDIDAALNYSKEDALEARTRFIAGLGRRRSTPTKDQA